MLKSEKQLHDQILGSLQGVLVVPIRESSTVPEGSSSPPETVSYRSLWIQYSAYSNGVRSLGMNYK